MEYAARMRILVALSLPLLACQSDGGSGGPAAPPGAPATAGAPGTPATTPATTPAEGTSPLAGATQVTFRFKDSSVPPQYHRSYSIVVTPKSIRKTIDSYGKVLGDGTAAFDQARFDKVLAAIARHQLARREPATGDGGCTGGTSHAIEVTDGTKTLLAGSQDHCGGSDSGSLTGDARAFDTELQAMAPAVSDGGSAPELIVQPPSPPK